MYLIRLCIAGVLFAFFMSFVSPEAWAAKTPARAKSATKKSLKVAKSAKGTKSFYSVRKGDSLYAISRKTGVSVADLMAFNGLESNRLRPGQKLSLKKVGVSAQARRPLLRDIDMRNDPEVILALSETGEFEVGGDDAPAGVTDRVIRFAQSMLDVPYKFGGMSLRGIDCSGLVKSVYNLVGLPLPRTAREQFNEGLPVEKEELSIGDLVFFAARAAKNPTHVGIYIGDNLFIHASSKLRKVAVDTLDHPYYTKHYVGARRLLGEGMTALSLE